MQPKLGTTETWVFTNKSGANHVIHLHDVDQQLVSRNGVAAKPWERMKESWNLAIGETIVLKVRFTDYLGKYVFHCHIIQHEVLGMMASVLVIALWPRIPVLGGIPGPLVALVGGRVQAARRLQEIVLEQPSLHLLQCPAPTTGRGVQHAVGAHDDGNAAALQLLDRLDEHARELLAAIYRIMGRELRYTRAGPRPGDLRHSCLDNGKAARVLGWKPAFGLEEGLTRTVAWFTGRA